MPCEIFGKIGDGDDDSDDPAVATCDAQPAVYRRKKYNYTLRTVFFLVFARFVRWRGMRFMNYVGYLCVYF